MRDSLGWPAALAASVSLLACNAFQSGTGLTEPGTHAGRVTLFRVDHSGPGASHTIGSDGAAGPRFVPLRHKADVRGLDGPDRIVTGEDLVMVTLKSAFVKFFREGLPWWVRLPGLEPSRRKGEVAVVLSFESGTAAKDSILVYSSQGQTLGSYLNLDDWPVVGPIKVDGPHLRMRVVVIELDQPENEGARQLVRAVTGVAAAAQPQAAAAISVGQQLADALIASNQDDVILDQRFALKRVTVGDNTENNPLLFGTYALVLQEDRLRGRDVEREAGRSVFPPSLSLLRFDQFSHRVYKVYNYLPIVPKPPDPVPAAAPCSDYDEDLPTLLAGLAYDGPGPLSLTGWFNVPAGNLPALYEDHRYRKCVLDKWVNREAAREIRRAQLGYRQDTIGDFEALRGLTSASKAIFVEAYRGFIQKPKEGDPGDLFSLLDEVVEPGRDFTFEYNVVLYPRAYVALAEYPLHTHLVFNISRSSGGAGDPVHQGFASYTDFLRDQIESARNEQRAETFRRALTAAVRANRDQATLFNQVKKMGGDEKPKKVCLLARELPQDDAVAPELPGVSDGAIYNELLHVTGEYWKSRAEAEAYLEQFQGCVLTNCSACPASL